MRRTALTAPILMVALLTAVALVAAVTSLACASTSLPARPTAAVERTGARCATGTVFTFTRHERPGPTSVYFGFRARSIRCATNSGR